MDFFRRLPASLRAGYLAFVAAFFRGCRALGRGASRANEAVIGAVSPVVPSEWKQRIALLFVTGLAFVPIIYSGNMTWSFEDPSGHLSRITAAVVDEDQGATASSPDGSTRQVDVGREFTDQLLDMDKDTVYTFVETDRATAEKGLEDGTYGAVVEVPKDFSANVASLGGDPAAAAPALLTVRTNDSINYVGGNFTKSVGTALKQSLAASVLDQYLDNVYIGFTTIHDNLVTAADGAQQLQDGSVQIADGASSLADAAAQLADGAQQLDDGSADLVVGLQQIDTGAQSLQQGTTQLADGAGTLAGGLGTLDSRSGQLRDGSATLADGAGQLRDGSATLADGTSQLAAGTQQLDSRVTSVQQTAADLGIDQASVDRTTTDLQQAVDVLATVATDVDAKLADPQSSAQDLAQAADTQANSVDTLATDARGLADRTAQGSTDATTVHDGATTIQDTISGLTQGIADADAGAAQHTADAQGAENAATTYTSSIDDLSGQCLGSGASQEFCDSLAKTAYFSQDLRDRTSDVARGAESQQQLLDAAAASGTDVATTTQSMVDASQRLTTLLDGEPGTDGLVATTDRIADGAEALQQPAHALADGAETLSTAITDVRSGIEAGTGGQDQPDARTDVQNRITSLHDQATVAIQALPDAYDRANAAVDAVHRLNQGAQQVDQGAQLLADSSGRLADGAGTLQQGVDQYTDGVSTARQGADALSAGAVQLVAGATRLSDATGQAVDGAETLHDGAGQLADGSAQLSEGAQRLREATVQLVDGATRLSDGLHDAEGQVPSYTETEREHLRETASDPVGLDFVREHGLGRFGEGLAPLFLSISLWVGGMAIFLMMPPFAESALRRGTSVLGLLAGGLIPAQVLGLVQTLIAVTILHSVVGIHVEHLGLFYALACLTSIVFVALNHGFGALAGPVGKFIALVLIALQVSGAGGTYPVGTLPTFFQAIHPYLPMTHTVDAFRGAIGGGWTDPAGDLAWILSWLMLALLLGAIGAALQRRRTQRDMSGAIPVES